jgi:pimeloyl-ACP methyl ester carboxylesterase
MADPTVERTLLQLPSGRDLEVQVAGPHDGVALVFHHGTPGSSFAALPLVDAAATRGLRLVAPSRAGYGNSSRDEGRDVASVAADTAAVLDALQIDRFVTVGWSGGGPHALACAAGLQGRCGAALSVAGVAPYLPEVFDFTAGMAQENVHEFSLSIEGGPAYDEMLSGHRELFLALKPGDVTSARDLFGDLVSDRDLAAATPETVAFLAENVTAGLASGYGGWSDDGQSFVSPWGFDVTSIAVPVGLWFGDHDLMVPPSHGEWLAANVPGAVTHHLADEGHLSLMADRLGEMLDEVCALAGLPW